MNSAVILLSAISLIELVILLVERQRLASRHVSMKQAAALVEKTPRGVHFYHVDRWNRLILIGANKAADSILGVNHQPLIGKTLEEAFPLLSSTEIPERYRETALKGLPWIAEQVNYQDDRLSGVYEVYTFQTAARGMAAVFSDITSRKEVEMELEDQRLFMKTVIESLPGIFYIYTWPDLKLFSWNSTHEKESGYSTTELKGASLLNWFDESRRAFVYDELKNIMETGEPLLIETSLRTKNGSTVDYLTSTRSFHGKDGPLLLGIGIDISARKKAERDLQLLNSELEDRVLERTRELSASRDRLEATLEELKASQDQLVLKEKMAALGNLVAGLAHELNTPLAAIQSACSSAQGGMDQIFAVVELYRGLTGENKDLFLRLTSCVEKVDFGRGMSDDRALRRSYRKVVEESGLADSSSLSEQLMEISYDGTLEELAILSRNPAFSEILGAAFQLASMVRALCVIQTSADKAGSVVQALRTYSHRDGGQGMVPSDVRSQLDTVLMILRNQLKYGVEVEKRYAEVPLVACFPDRLSQVWLNLITNAGQAMNYEGHLELDVRKGPLGVDVSVTDTGPGIPVAIQKRIFEPFFTTKKAGEGTGLGLDICRRILEEIGATICFESKSGRTTFTVSLPEAKEGGI